MLETSQSGAQSSSRSSRCLKLLNNNNCCFSVPKNPPFRLIFLLVGLALPLTRIVLHILCHKRPSQARAGCPHKCPSRQTLRLSLFSAQPAPVPWLPKPSGFSPLYFWEGNSVSGPMSAARCQDNLEVTAGNASMEKCGQEHLKTVRSSAVRLEMIGGWKPYDEFIFKMNPSEACELPLKPTFSDHHCVLPGQSALWYDSKVCNLQSRFPGSVLIPPVLSSSHQLWLVWTWDC